MNLTKAYLVLGLVVGSCLATITTSAHALTLDSGSSTTAASPFGNPDTQTYGQLFTTPTAGTLTNFELSLNGSVGGELFGGIGIWDSATHGVSSVVYQSGNLASAAGAFTYSFAPNLNLTVGTIYVAFLSVFGTDAISQTTMPLVGYGGSGDPNLLSFVFHNANDGGVPGPNSGFWEGEFAAYDAQFKATIAPSAVPLPAALPLLVTGIGGLAAMSRRRKRKSA